MTSTRSPIMAAEVMATDSNSDTQKTNDRRRFLGRLGGLGAGVVGGVGPAAALGTIMGISAARADTQSITGHVAAVTSFTIAGNATQVATVLPAVLRAPTTGTTISEAAARAAVVVSCPT